jgi:hypothetical protein
MKVSSICSHSAKNTGTSEIEAASRGETIVLKAANVELSYSYEIRTRNKLLFELEA